MEVIVKIPGLLSARFSKSGTSGDVSSLLETLCYFKKVVVI